jgi:hypothetical protein
MRSKDREPRSVEMKTATVWTNGNGTTARRAAWLTLATAAAMVATALLSGAAAADPARRGMETGNGDVRLAQQELRQDRWDQRQDWMDVRQFQRLVARLEDAQRARSWNDESRFRRQIHQMIRRELEEGRRDMFVDRRERGSEPSRQGRRDDEKDFRQSRQRFEREREIARELRMLQDNLDRGAWRARARERALLGEFGRLMREDARQSDWELREDRRDFRDRHDDGPDDRDYRDDRN